MIDTSMYNRPADIPDISKVFDTYNNQRTIQDMAQIRKMELAQAKEDVAAKKQEAAKQKTLKGLLEVNTNVAPDGRISIDPRYASDAAKLGFAQEGLAFQQEQDKQNRERFVKLLDTRKNVLSKVRPGNLQDYDAARKALLAAGDDLDGIPNRLQFITDPGSLDMHFREVLSEKEKLDAQLKTRELDIMEGKANREAQAEALEQEFATQVLPGLAKEIEGIGTDQTRKRALVAKLRGSKYGNTKAVAGLIDDLGKQDTPFGQFIQATREAELRDRQEKTAYDQAEEYQTKKAKDLSAAQQLIGVNDALEKLGVPGGIYGDPNKANIGGTYGVGAKAFRRYLQSDDAVGLRNSVAWLHNGIRNKLFGASLTAGELKAFEEAAGTGVVSNTADFFSGLKNIQRELDQSLRPIVNERAAQILKDRGVYTNENLPKAPAAPGAFKVGETKTLGNGIKVTREK